LFPGLEVLIAQPERTTHRSATLAANYPCPLWLCHLSRKINRPREKDPAFTPLFNTAWNQPTRHHADGPCSVSWSVRHCFLMRSIGTGMPTLTVSRIGLHPLQARSPGEFIHVAGGDF